MSFVEAVRDGVVRWNDWSGRSSLAQFGWWLVLASIVGVPVVGLLAVIEVPSLVVMFVVLPVWLFLMVAGAGVIVRRLHDTGRSGWNYWWSLIPLIGAIVLLVFLALPGDEDWNQYGEVVGV